MSQPSVAVEENRPFEDRVGGRGDLWFLIICGGVTGLVYAAICWLSFDCEQSDPKQSRPLLTVMSLFTVAGVMWLLVCWKLVWRQFDEKTNRSVSTLGSPTEGVERSKGSALSHPSVVLVLLLGIVFRLVLLFSVPIQEVDLFRYIWDGTVVSQGISPYEYSPQEVELLPQRGIPNYRTKLTEREDLALLSNIATSPGMDAAFPLVHFKEYTTPYPLVNQGPFAVAAVIGLATESFWGLLYSMKGVLIVFDVATALLLMGLLKKLSLPPVWVVAYFWCPLLLKEIANSGHLDSIAVFLTTLAVYLMVRIYWPNQERAADPAATPTTSPTIISSCVVAVVLAAAVAAKLFPLVLGPIWALVMFRRIRFSATVPIVLFFAVTAVLLWPMVGRTTFVQTTLQQIQSEWVGVDDPHVALQPTGIAAPPAGIEAFVKYWEMNDFIFMILIENLKPYGKSAQQYQQETGSGQSKVWFVKTSNEFRHSIAQWYQQWSGVPKHSAPFSITRRVTLIAFGLIVAWSCFRMWRRDDPLVFLEMVFLTIAWFWFLAPTQNPWYWTWALPWLVFCRNRIWYLVAVVAMAYYLRFYFEYHGIVGPEETGLLGTPYAGTAFFDFIFPVLEFAPILLGLALSWLFRGLVYRKRGPGEMAVESVD